MQRIMKKAIALLLAFAMSAALCACGNTNLEGTVVEPTPSGDATGGSLSAELSEALILPDGTSFLDVYSGMIPDDTVDSALSPKMAGWSFDDIPAVDEETAGEWRNLVQEQERQKDKVASLISRPETENAEDEFNVYANDLRQLFDVGPGILSSDKATSMEIKLVSFAVNFLVKEAMKSAGIDITTTEEKILDKLKMLDDIYEALNRVEDKVNEINLRLKDDQYYSAIDERQNCLREVSLATHQRYLVAIQYLCEGYDEYLGKSEAYDLLESKDFQYKNFSKEEREYFLKVSFDKDFYYAKFFMDGEETLANYMMYRLMYNSDSVVNIINEWAQSTVDGTSICAELGYLFTSYAGNDILGRKSYPEIYDYFAYRTYPWEHFGYEYREAIRNADNAILYEAYTMANLYYTVKSASNSQAVAEREQQQMAELVAAYNQVQAEQAVVRRENYYICQIPGCEYVFAGTPVYFDYYSLFKDYLNGYKFEDDDEKVPEDTGKALDALFYNIDIAYSYDALNESQKGSYTFDHAAIGAAGDPFGAVDWDEVSSFADTFETQMLYLPQSAYKALLDYYKPYGYTSITAILNDVLGISFADGTNLVCDMADTKNTIESKAFSTSCTYYYHAFRLIQKELSKNGDYIDVRTCLKDDSGDLKNIRFAENLNIKTTDGCPINGWGKAKNRFGGLMILGAPRISY